MDYEPSWLLLNTYLCGLCAELHTAHMTMANGFYGIMFKSTLPKPRQHTPISLIVLEIKCKE